MSCCPGRNSGSSSVAFPRIRGGFSTVSCHWGGGMGYQSLNNFSSRSLDGLRCFRSSTAAGRCRPLGHGFGAAGTGFSYRGVGFGYRVGGVSRPWTITPITIHEELLKPLRLELDPKVQKVKFQEKEQIKTLNNKFASFIDKVRLLEQQNKVLETKWSFLQGQKHCKDPTRPMVEASVGNLKKQLEALRKSRAQLERDLKEAEQVLETNKKMYKDEHSQRTCAESEVIALKKDMDSFFLTKAKLEAKVESLKEEVEFLRVLYREEVQQLQAQMWNTSVVMQVDNSQNLGLDGVTADVRAQYEDIACRSRAEAQARCESKFKELQVTAGRNADRLQDAKPKIAELTGMVQSLNREIRSTKEQCCKLEAALASTEQHGEKSIRDAKHKLSELEAALQQTKAELSRQLCEYQELMSIKVALDIEIITYKKLLEGEENR
ncbi:keratin, type II cuticular Hb4 [Calypte anna]|uniref:keratin, type II cuticular Hb4 n=1 Tax=Calypte anna TaxID=9244 RepID=UPI0011C40F6A|nr:keratin, type II cuticular Hb4 [Calypte anna]